MAGGSPAAFEIGAGFNIGVRRPSHKRGFVRRSPDTDPRRDGLLVATVAELSVRFNVAELKPCHGFGTVRGIAGTRTIGRWPASRWGLLAARQTLVCDPLTTYSPGCRTPL